MAWFRYGQIYVPAGGKEWSRSHAAQPTAMPIEGDRHRLFFSTRDANNRSSVGWIDVNLDDRPRVLDEAQSPALHYGTPGMFDDSGASIGSIVHDGAKHRLYYMGWNLSVLAPWRNSIGVAASDSKGEVFERMFNGPIMDRSPKDPFTLSYPWVLRLAPNDWRMWYGSNTKWGATAADMYHVIKAARSDDGLHWRRSDSPALDASQPGEYAFARPAVLVEDGLFRMWFAVRGERYAIGYAESPDGQHWSRSGEFALAPSAEGWDSEMTCYPCPIRHKGTLYLAYNGNSYGRTGIGLAVWRD